MKGLLIGSDGYALGYLFQFEKGTFSPSGRADYTEAEVKAHNGALARLEVERLKREGRGVMYLTTGRVGGATVETWDGLLKFKVYGLRYSWHNMTGKNGRVDFDFEFDGSRWHGIKIGNMQLARVRRCKL